MKQLIRASTIAPNNPIKAQFSFSNNGYAYWGVITPTSVWYKFENIDARNTYDFILLPIPTSWETAEEYEYLVLDEESPCYPFDEYKFSKITKQQLLKRIHQEGMINYDKNCNIKGTLRATVNKPYMLVAGNTYYACKDTEALKIATSSKKSTDWYLIGMDSCDILMDIDLSTAYQIVFDANIEQGIPIYCCIRFPDYDVILSVAAAKNCINKGFKNLKTKITADQNGKLGKETIMNMMNDLKGLHVFGSETVKTKLEEVANENREAEFIKALENAPNNEPIKLATTVINIAPEEVEKPTTITVEEVKEYNKVTPMTESEKAIPMTESDRVIPMTVPSKNVENVADIPPKNVEKTAETPQENVENVTETPQENVLENTKVGEEQPLTIDSLRYEFTELKTKVTLFDKHLREFAKTGACSKKSQTELEKYKAENMKLREEVKRLSKAADQFEKIQKYLADLSK